MFKNSKSLLKIGKHNYMNKQEKSNIKKICVILNEKYKLNNEELPTAK